MIEALAPNVADHALDVGPVTRRSGRTKHFYNGCKRLNRFGSPHWTHFELLRCKTWSDRTIPIAFSSMTSARYLHAHPDWGPGLDKSRTSQVVNPADGVPALPTRSFFFQFHAVRNGLH